MFKQFLIRKYDPSIRGKTLKKFSKLYARSPTLMTFYETINLNRLKIEYMAGANKKTSIIETAARLFSLQGYEATTTLMMAGETGITEPNV